MKTTMIDIYIMRRWIKENKEAIRKYRAGSPPDSALHFLYGQNSLLNELSLVLDSISDVDKDTVIDTAAVIQGLD